MIAWKKIENLGNEFDYKYENQTPELDSLLRKQLKVEHLIQQYLDKMSQQCSN